jgi:folate-dependent phosphoribosylglycinamide formyltransferase PurN
LKGVEEHMIYTPQTVHSTDVKPLIHTTQEEGIIAMMDRGGSTVKYLSTRMPGLIKLVVTTDPNHTKCNAPVRAQEIGVECVAFDIRSYERDRGIASGDYLRALEQGSAAAFKGTETNYKTIIGVRADACARMNEAIEAKCKELGLNPRVPRVALGMMNIMDDQTVSEYLTLNSHPGSLTAYRTLQNTIDGKTRVLRSRRHIVGDGWVPSAHAIAAGHEKLYSSFHLMTKDMDAGPVLMRGYALPIDYNFLESFVDIADPLQLRIAAEHAQDALKEIGDYVIVPATLRDLFAGKWGTANNTLAYKMKDDWLAKPVGITPEDHTANDRRTTIYKTQADLLLVQRKFSRALEGVRTEAERRRAA